MKIYQDIISEYELEATPFFQFCQSSTQEEFFEFQLPFYHAVVAFPRILCAAGAKITDSATRLQIIENLWEEHGGGNSHQFHSETYREYLCALQKSRILPAIPHNIFVSHWIDKCLHLPYSAEKTCAYLAGIEFIYTRVSQTIAHKVSAYHIVQSHYNTHEKLDYQHATELLETAHRIQDADHSNSFYEGVEDFMEMLTQLTFITRAQAKSISEERISFYYGREDCAVEIRHGKDESRILCIASGGEHIIHLKNNYPNSHITALDINRHQLDLVEKKISQLGDMRCVLDTGKFERMFAVLSSRIDNHDIHAIKHSQDYGLQKLRIICQDVFSRQNLDTIFGKSATQYSSENFAEHFYQVFKKEIIAMNDKPSNIYNILNLGFPCIYPQSITGEINYWEGDLYSYFESMKISQEVRNIAGDTIENYQHSEKLFDTISISNIGDWMSVQDYQKLLCTLKTKLNPQGKLIARKLLGDYCLQDMMREIFSQVEIEQDNTGFYKECIVGCL